MNLKNLFELQAKLDERIYKEHPVQEGEDRLAKKILALQVELGELANEWRGFKFWSSDQEPRTTAKCETCDGLGNDIYFTGSYDNGNLQECSEPCEYCDGTGDDDSKNPLLEEYVDCLHFILSIGLEVGADDFLESYDDWSYMAEKNVVNLFATLYQIDWGRLDDNSSDEYFEGFEYFMTLGRELGFTWEQIEEAYLTKNKINHTRQTTGY